MMNNREDEEQEKLAGYCSSRGCIEGTGSTADNYEKLGVKRGIC